ncbi:MAG: hypothetical protein GX786_05060 [Clostridiales bacterium]|nr:hypothetical protein [Clostridiales bacterium]
MQGKETSLLLDAGDRFEALMGAGEALAANVGALVTHEHKDHTAMVSRLLRYGIEVYATKGTAEEAGFNDHILYKRVVYGKNYQAGEFTFMPFETIHDAAEPCGYLIRYNPEGIYILYATDTKAINHLFPQVHYWIVECNFSVETLNRDVLHPAVIKRIINNHLSLERLVKYFDRNDLKNTRAIYLCHLSENNADGRGMVKKIEESTRKKTIPLQKDLEMTLSLIPF